MSATPQLRLVQDAPPTFNPATTDPVRQVFEHWLLMFGRSPARCKLGPTRRTAIVGALGMGYAVDDLLLAIEGLASDPVDLPGRPDADAARIRDAVRQVEWLLAREQRIERWMAKGEQLRGMVDQPAPLPQAQQAPAVVQDPAATAAARARLAALARQMREASHG